MDVSSINFNLCLFLFMIHPDTEVRFINEIIGYGVVAKKHIPKGTITWVQDPLNSIYQPKDLQKFSKPVREMIDTYSFRNNKGEYILCWDIAKYVNHSFNSNCLTTAYDFEIAIRNIEPGEQLTDDYGYLNITEPFRAYDEGDERKVVYPDDLLRYFPVWDAKLVDAFYLVETTKQPLKKYFTPEKWREVQTVLQGKKPLASIFGMFLRQRSRPLGFIHFEQIVKIVPLVR